MILAFYRGIGHFFGKSSPRFGNDLARVPSRIPDANPTRRRRKGSSSAYGISCGGPTHHISDMYTVERRLDVQGGFMNASRAHHAGGRDTWEVQLTELRVRCGEMRH